MISRRSSSSMRISEGRKSHVQECGSDSLYLQDRTRSVVDLRWSAGNVTSCVEIMKAQSFLCSNSRDNSGAVIARWRCRSGSSINSSVPGSAVRTSAAIRNALRSPSESSATLYGRAPGRVATIFWRFSTLIAIGMLERRRSSFTTAIGAGDFTLFCASAIFPMRTKSAMARASMLSASIRS